MGGFLGLAIAIGRGGFTRARVSGILFCLAVAAHTLTQLPEIRAVLSVAWAPIWLFSVVGAGLFWLFAVELFEDRERFEIRHLVLVAALLGLSVGTTITTGNNEFELIETRDEVHHTPWGAEQAFRYHLFWRS